jgi:hypothetical protein
MAKLSSTMPRIGASVSFAILQRENISTVPGRRRDRQIPKSPETPAAADEATKLTLFISEIKRS